jgi:uncharacterized membrane-anchored protein
MWINIATLAVGVIGYLVGQDMISDNASLVAVLVAVQGAVNIALRFITTKKIV